MSLTQGADLYGSIHENGFNKVLEVLKKKRPKRFNYGTSFFIANPEEAPLQPLSSGDITKQKEFFIPGTNDGLPLHYVAQINDVSVDFFPRSLPQHPPEISARENEAVLVIDAALSVAHPVNVVVTPEIDPIDNKIRPRYAFDLETLATRLKVWGKADASIVMEWKNLDDADSEVIPKLRFNVLKIEVEDITPDSLEEIIEVVARDVIQFGFLETFKLPMSFLVLDLFSISVDDTISPNPAIKNDRAEAWFKVEFDSDS